jgi:hypothetical protein
VILGGQSLPFILGCIELSKLRTSLRPFRSKVPVLTTEVSGWLAHSLLDGVENPMKPDFFLQTAAF